MLPLISPTGQKVSGVNDAANQPFWFNGQDQVGFTPALAAGNVRQEAVVQRQQADQSAACRSANKLKPITVTFKKTGKFTYYCNIHAGMKGTVTVKDKGKSIPSAKADKKALARQVATALKHVQEARQHAGAGQHGRRRRGAASTARSCSRSCRAPSTVPVGHDVDVPDAPGLVRRAHGDDRPGQPGDRAELLPRPDRGELQQSPVFDPRAVYPSEPPARPGP